MLFCYSPKAQLLKKIKDKANQAVDKALDKKVNETTTTVTPVMEKFQTKAEAA